MTGGALVDSTPACIEGRSLSEARIVRLETRPRERAEPVRGALLAGAWIGTFLSVAAFSRLPFLWPACHFREWTGIPCLTCGSTRMIDALLSGSLLEAAAWNPLVFLGLAGATVWVCVTAAGMALGRPVRRLVTSQGERLGLWLLGAGVVVTGWAYLVWRGI